MLGGGGCDGAIHRAAGPELLEACYRVPEVGFGIRCPTGEARITPGFKLPASHVIHTVGPIYGVTINPEASLRSAYKNSLSLAKANNIQYIAFPAISCGLYWCTLFCLQMISTIFGWRRQGNCCLFHLEDVKNFEVGTSSKLMSFEQLVYQSLDQKIRGILQEIGLQNAQIMSICRFSKMSKLHFPLNFCCKLQICTY
ncbi:uncharacterized protein LOC102609366 isoform X3 [Citrus sinensis]|nr:uncharacterized protein LOC102609366 isoform X3 [Citrus sinensis]